MLFPFFVKPFRDFIKKKMKVFSLYNNERKNRDFNIILEKKLREKHEINIYH